MRGLSKLGLCLVTACVSTIAAADIIVDGQTLPNSAIASYNISVVDGAYTVTITTVDGWTLAPSDTAPPPPPPPPPPTDGPVTVTLTATPTVAELGEAVNFSWVSTNAVSCTTRLGNDEWKAYTPSPLDVGNVDITMDALGSTLFRIRCEGADGSSKVWGQTVDVIPASTTQASCDSPEVANGMIRDWSEFFGDTFPDTAIFEKQEFIRYNRYLAIRFNTGSVQASGVVETIQLSDGVRNVSVNECPGVFLGNVGGSSVNPCFGWQANGQVLNVSTDGSTACDLEPNKEYFINVTYVDVEDLDPSATSFCQQTECGFKINAPIN